MRFMLVPTVITLYVFCALFVNSLAIGLGFGLGFLGVKYGLSKA